MKKETLKYIIMKTRKQDVDIVTKTCLPKMTRLRNQTPELHLQLKRLQKKPQIRIMSVD